MDPFGYTPEQHTAAAMWVAAGAAVLTFGVLAGAAWIAVGQLNEARKLRREQTRPYVVPSIDIEQEILFLLSLENVGKTPAFNVRVEFDEPPQSLKWDIANLRMLNEPIPTMPPGQKFRAYWERSLDVFDKKKPYPHPLTYRVNVTYEAHDGHSYGPEGYTLDFRVYGGQATGRKGLTELIKAVEQLAAEHKKWTDGSRGLNVNAWDADRDSQRDDRPWHLRQARRAYDKDRWKGWALYWINHWRRRHGLWSK